MCKEYIYYWYDYLSRDKIPTIIESITKSIKNKDFNSFMFYYNCDLNHKEYFLPNMISVFEGDDLIEHISIENEENFKKITFNEYECG